MTKFLTFAVLFFHASCQSVLGKSYGESSVVAVQEIIGYVNGLKRDSNNELQDRPFVLASYAQSIDGFIAPWDDIIQGKTTSNYPLSSKDSLMLTHAIRSQFDCVLIGGATLSIDNPRLTNRLWLNKDAIPRQPRPVILDTHLSHIQQIKNVRVENPIVCCSQEAAARIDRLQLPQNFNILQCKLNRDGKLHLPDVLRNLRHKFQIQSVMVEGGAGVLSSFFSEDLVDAVCVTIAPKFLNAGISPSVEKNIDLANSGLRIYVVGNDVVLLSKFQRRSEY